MSIKRIKTILCFTVALAIAVLTSTVVLASADTDEDGPFTYRLECGDQYTLIGNARSDGRLFVHSRSVKCKGEDVAVTVLVVKDDKARTFCTESSEPCTVSFAKGSSVAIGLMSSERSGEERSVRGAVKYSN